MFIINLKKRYLRRELFTIVEIIDDWEFNLVVPYEESLFYSNSCKNTVVFHYFADMPVKILIKIHKFLMSFKKRENRLDDIILNQLTNINLNYNIPSARKDFPCMANFRKWINSSIIKNSSLSNR